MNPDAVSSKNTRRRLALALGLFLFSVYLFTYRGGFHSVDEVSIFAVTESLAKFGRFNTDQIAWTQWTTSQAEAQGFFGVGGHVYSKKGLALSLAQAPLYWLAFCGAGATRRRLPFSPPLFLGCQPLLLYTPNIYSASHWPGFCYC